MNDNQEKHFKIKEVVDNYKELKISDKKPSRAVINRWCREGKFPNAYKKKTEMGDLWMIPESDLKLFVLKMGRPKKDT